LLRELLLLGGVLFFVDFGIHIERTEPPVALVGGIKLRELEQEHRQFRIIWIGVGDELLIGIDLGFANLFDFALDKENLIRGEVWLDLRFGVFVGDQTARALGLFHIDFDLGSGPLVARFLRPRGRRKHCQGQRRHHTI
jgi:hypothetical protein